MPVRRVKGGYQWGDQKVYPTRAQAEAQGKAIMIAQSKKK